MFVELEIQNKHEKEMKGIHDLKYIVKIIAFVLFDCNTEKCIYDG